LKVLDLFSGIGGFSIGLEKAGFETVAFCEIEPYCRGVLERHWPDTPIYGDVKQLTGEQLRADGIVPDVIVGGYPCQPFSVAGRQRGEEDPRHLWPEVHRLIRELRPRWVICENVSGHIKLGLDEVLATLEAEGYTCWPFIIAACSVDAPHKRDRVWIVAHANSGADGRASGQNESADGEVSKRDNGGVSDKSGEVRTSMADTNNRQLDGENKEVFSGRHTTADGGQDVADSTSERLQGRTEEPAYGVGDLQRQSERGGTDFRDGWPTEPNVGRVANGVSNRSHRIKALGNAVVPQIPEAIGLTIMQYEGKYYGFNKHST
jgi:DNA (cytosine-5)-methyltransferase 1